MTDTGPLHREEDGKFPVVTLSTGSHHRVVVVLGKPSPTLTVPGSRFGYNLAYPTPGIAGAVRFAVEALDEAATMKATVFGHTDKTGSDQYNKDLSDRRAAAFLAVLTDDPRLFGEVAQAEDWDLSIYQSMLRAVGANPGPIDGKSGDLTTAAVEGFQNEYPRGVYHRDTSRSPTVSLTPSGSLDAPTKEAIRDAYLGVFSGQLAAKRFAGPKRAGCSEFIPLSDSAEDNRRVTLAVFRGALTPRDDEFPCVEGDVSACPLDRSSGRRCSFYRERINEPEDPEFAGDVIPFFDFQWLRGSDTVTHLSALTSIADGVECTFTIHQADSRLQAATVPDSDVAGAPPEIGTLVTSIPGTIKNGVAFAKWEHSAEENPFDVEKWIVDLDEDVYGLDEDDDEPTRATQSLFDSEGFLPPVFTIKTPDGWGLSAPPGHALNRVALVGGGGSGLALSSTGFLIPFSADEGPVNAVDQVIVVSLATAEAVALGADEELPESDEEAASS